MAGTETPIPVRIKPQLVSLVTKPPADGACRWEIKIDGFRFLARIDGRVVRLFTKNGHDWTNKVPRLARSLARLAVHSAWMDGEIVFQQEDGRPVFHALRPAFDSGQTDPLVLAVCCPHQWQLWVDSSRSRMAAVDPKLPVATARTRPIPVVAQYLQFRTKRARARSWWITAALLAAAPRVVIFTVYRGK